MSKFDLSSIGVAAFQKQFSELSNKQLLREADAITEDPLKWLSAHFELQVVQVETLRSIPEIQRKAVGVFVLAALLSGIPVQYSHNRMAAKDDVTDPSPNISLQLNANYHLKDDQLSPKGDSAAAILIQY